MRSTIAMYLLHRGLPAVVGLTILLLQPVAAGQGLIFSVQRDDGPQSYLIGTMHSEDQRVIGLLDQFEPLVGQVEVVVVELVPDAVTMLAVSAATLLPADRSLRGLIGDDQFAALAEAASTLGLPAEVLDRLKPWAAAITVGLPASRTGRFLDMEIYLHALKLQKRVIGLETAAEQLAVFDQMPQDAQLVLLAEMVKNVEQVPKQLEELTAVYLEGDLALIEEVARSQYDSMPAPITQWFDDQLLDQRNIRMLDRLRDLLERQRTLVAVGAMHLAGDTGLVAGLRRLGYRVERRN